MKSVYKSFSSLFFQLFMGLRIISYRNSKNKLIFAALFAGIAGGLAILIVVIGVMNGFQNNYITRRIEIGSYHANISNKNGISGYRDIVSKLYNTFPEIEACVPYADREVIMLFKNRANSDKQPVKLRAIDTNEIFKDTGFMNYCKIVRGDFFMKENEVLLGEELGWRQITFAKQGHTVYITPDITISSLNQTGKPFTVNGYFNTGSYDYDRYWVFIGLQGLYELTGKDVVDAVGIKFKKSADRKKIINSIKELYPDMDVKSAQEINRGYFAALKLEKTMISFLFVIIFIMVGINIFGALKLTILEKKDSILILKAIGLPPTDIQAIFMLESFILAIGGTITGLILGIFISSNILNIFAFVESILNAFQAIALPDFARNPIKLYDTSIYYQTDLLVKFYPIELALSAFSVFMMTILSALYPIMRSSKMRPHEINRNKI